MAEDIDIIAELNKSTEPIETTVSKETVEEVFNKIENPVFEDTEEDSEDVQEAEVVDEKEPVKPTSAEEKAATKRGAFRWVKAFNSLMKATLPSIYRKKILHPGDIEVLEAHKKKKDLNPRYNLEEAVTNDDLLYNALKRFETLEKYINDAPLSQDEMNDIAEPLAECMEKYKWMKMGPEGDLLMSVAIVMLPRLEPILPNFSSYLDRMFSTRK